MERRHQRRTARPVLTAALTAAVLITGSGLVSSTPAAAAATGGRVAGTGIARTDGTPLNMRSAPTASSVRLGTVVNGGKVWIMCQVVAEHVNGTVRATRIWNRLANNTWVSDAYVARRYYRIPVCTRAQAAAGSWARPVGAWLVSGFRTRSRPMHDGVDLGAARWTPIHSVAAGRVIRVECNVSTNNCNVDGSPNLRGCGWYAEVQHAGNVVTRYCHMVRRPAVNVGQAVFRGQIIGYVGTSGSSTGPHLHFEVHTGAPPAVRANAVNPIWFMRARGIALG